MDKGDKARGKLVGGGMRRFANIPVPNQCRIGLPLHFVSFCENGVIIIKVEFQFNVMKKYYLKSSSSHE
jgi:hypothetical protein